MNTSQVRDIIQEMVKDDVEQLVVITNAHHDQLTAIREAFAALVQKLTDIEAGAQKTSEKLERNTEGRRAEADRWKTVSEMH